MSDLPIPAPLVETTLREHGADGPRWLERLPAIVAEVAERWSLTLEAPFPNLSYNWVAPVRRAGGEPAVLRVCFPDEEFATAAAALRIFDGRAAVAQLAVDEERSAVLVEWLEPGTPVSALGDDVAETSAAASVMRDLWRPLPPRHPFPHARDWIAAARAEGTLPAAKRELPWARAALDTAAELARDGSHEVLLHGDLHHENILAAGRSPWLAIDPKGVAGDPACEIAPFLFNNLPEGDERDVRAIVRRRSDQLADELALDRRRVYAFSAVRSFQSAFWSLRDVPRPWRIAVVCAEELAAGP